jgi:hypothetical protein
MSDDKITPPRYSAEEWARLRAAFDAAREADAKLGPDAYKWIDDLPEAPPLGREYTTAIFLGQPDSDDDVEP